MPASERLEELAGDLDRVAEGLVDVAMDLLRSALGEEGEAAIARARATEKLVNRARSSAEKAARLARQAAGSPLDEAARD